MVDGKGDLDLAVEDGDLTVGALLTAMMMTASGATCERATHDGVNNGMGVWEGEHGSGW